MCPHFESWRSRTPFPKSLLLQTRPALAVRPEGGAARRLRQEMLLPTTAPSGSCSATSSKGEKFSSNETVGVTLFNRLFPNLLTRGQQTSAKAQIRKSFRLWGSSRVPAATSPICHRDMEEVRTICTRVSVAVLQRNLFTDPEM